MGFLLMLLIFRLIDKIKGYIMSDTNMNQTNQEIPAWLAKADIFRFNMPEEQKYPWLSFLLDAYALIDASVQNAIEEASENKKTLACKEGCYTCCQQLVPITPAEAMGIRLTVNEFLPKAEREPLLEQLQAHEGNAEWNDGTCPFIKEGSCAIYAFRPIACRRSLITGLQCNERDDDLLEDALIPDRAALYAALAHTSPIYESIGMTEKGTVLSFENFKELFVDIRSVNWAKL